MIYFTYRQNQHCIAHLFEHLISVVLQKNDILVKQANTGSGYSLISADFSLRNLNDYIDQINKEEFDIHKNLVISEEMGSFLHKSHVYSRILSKNYTSADSFLSQIKNLAQLQFNQLNKVTNEFHLYLIQSEAEIQNIGAVKTNYLNFEKNNIPASPPDDINAKIKEILCFFPCVNYIQALIVAEYYYWFIKKAKQTFYEQGDSYYFDSLLVKPASTGLTFSLSLVTTTNPSLPLLMPSEEECVILHKHLIANASHKSDSLSTLIQQQLEWGHFLKKDDLIKELNQIDFQNILEKLVKNVVVSDFLL